MIAITGSEGYIGRQLCGKLSNDELLRIDYTRGLSVQDYGSLPSTTSLVFHLSALTSPGESQICTAAYHEDNLVATRHLIKMCRNMYTPPRVVFASTCAVYGDCHDKYLLESSATYPVSYYGLTKLACEMLLLSSGLNVRILRIFNVVGKGGGHPGRLLPTLLRNFAAGNVTNIYGPNTLRDYVHVDDVVEALMKAATTTSPSRIFNIGTGKGTTPLALARLVANVTGNPPLLHLEDRRPYDPPHAVCDPSLARAELAWEPTISLEETVKQEWANQIATS